MGSKNGRRRTVEQIAAGTLTTHDERVQRALIPSRVKELTRTIDLDAIGVITVSARPDGQLMVLDGQHRVTALMELGMGDWEVTCHVHHGLTVQDEAGLFRLLNNTRRPSAVDDYLKGVVEGDPECAEIDEIITSAGLRVALQTGPGLISCVGAMRKIYRGKSPIERGGPRALEGALQTALAAWGQRPEATEGHIIAGLGQFFLRYDENIDRPALIRKLAKYKGGPSGLVGSARALYDIRGGTVGRCVAALIVDTYNRGRRSQLDPI